MGTRRYIISDASKMLKVESHVLRYWEEELEIKIPRNEMGHRYYTEENIELLRKIRDLKEQGYGLRTIKMMINGEIDINRSNPNTVNIRNLFDKPKSEKNTFYKEDEEGVNAACGSHDTEYQGDWKKGIGDHLYIPGRIPESDPADPAGRANKPKKGGMICGKKKQKGNCGAPCTGDRSLLPRWSLCAAFR